MEYLNKLKELCSSNEESNTDKIYKENDASIIFQFEKDIKEILSENEGLDKLFKTIIMYKNTLSCYVKFHELLEEIKKILLYNIENDIDSNKYKFYYNKLFIKQNGKPRFIINDGVNPNLLDEEIKKDILKKYEVPKKFDYLDKFKKNDVLGFYNKIKNKWFIVEIIDVILYQEENLYIFKYVGFDKKDCVLQSNNLLENLNLRKHKFYNE